jgi:hypothetical protein
VRNWNVLAALFVLAWPSLSSAQSIILSEPSRVTLVAAPDRDGGVRLTATVTTEQGTGVPGGTIQFIDDSTLAVLGWADVASPSIRADNLSPGQHRIHADYSGTMDFLPLMVQPSRSATLAETVRGLPEVTVSSSDNPSKPGQMVTLTAVVGEDARGMVTFRDGGRPIASHVGLDRAGVASFTTSALPDGSRAITAEYEGDTAHAPAVSSRLVQDVGVTRSLTSQLRD